eukprot:scaffold1361_cov18-Tisochrysis_lutea.AAC.6
MNPQLRCLGSRPVARGDIHVRVRSLLVVCCVFDAAPCLLSELSSAITYFCWRGRYFHSGPHFVAQALPRPSFPSELHRA